MEWDIRQDALVEGEPEYPTINKLNILLKCLQNTDETLRTSKTLV